MYVLLGLILISTPFWIISIWNEEVDNLPCYDKYDNVMGGLTCSGTQNIIMEKIIYLVIIVAIIGTALFTFNFLDLLNYVNTRK